MISTKIHYQLSPEQWRNRQGKDFGKKIRRFYKQGVVSYLLERCFEVDAALSYRQKGKATDMTGGGFFRGVKNPGNFRLSQFFSLVEHEAINHEVFVKALAELRNNRKRYRGIGVASAVAMVAKELGCVPPWTDHKSPVCLEDDGAVVYSYLSMIPKEQWPTSVENARFITLSPEMAEKVCRLTVELTPEAISPAEVGVSDDKVAVIENVLRAWAYSGTYVMEAMAAVWAIPSPEERLGNQAKRKKRVKT
jgi:hypothetical protein